MNKERRKKIDSVIERLNALKEQIEGSFRELAETVGEVRDEEQEYLDNMAEGFRQGEKGDKAETAVGALDEAANTLDEIAEKIDDLDDIISNLETAKE